MKFPLGRRTAVIAFVVLLALGLVAGSAALHHRSSPPRYVATPEGENGEADGLSRLEAYWNDRITYPTGNYNPAWLQHAAAQAERIPSRVPKGIYPSSPRGVFAAASASRSAALASFDTKAAISLGPKPERMTGCGNCFDYTTTSGRINAIVIDPTTTTPGSITAYSAAVGGGVWKTTNCCTASTTWTVDHGRSARRHQRDRHARARPERSQHDLRGHRRPQLRVVLDGQPGHPQVDRRRRPLDRARREHLRSCLQRARGSVPAVRRGRQGPRRSEQLATTSSPARRRASSSRTTAARTGPARARRTASRRCARTSPASSCPTWAAA